MYLNSTTFKVNLKYIKCLKPKNIYYFKVNVNSNFNNNPVNYLVLPFLENFTDVNNIAKSFNVSIVNRSNTTLKSMLKNNCRYLFYVYIWLTKTFELQITKEDSDRDLIYQRTYTNYHLNFSKLKT